MENARRVNNLKSGDHRSIPYMGKKEEVTYLKAFNRYSSNGR